MRARDCSILVSGWVIEYEAFLWDVGGERLGVLGWSSSYGMPLVVGVDRSLMCGLVVIFMIPYHGLFLCDIQVSVLRMEINQSTGEQSLRGVTHDEITMG